MVIRKFLRTFIMCASLNALLCAGALAQDVQFTAEVDQNKVALGSSAQWTLTVTGAQDVPDPQIPAVDGLDIRYLGPATRISIVNGQYSSKKSWMYSVLPTKVGSFTIPSVQIHAGGQTYTTQPVTIDVVDEGSGIPSPVSPGGGASASLADKIFLVLRLAKEKVYVNERLPIKILLFIADVGVADVRFPELKQPGVDVEKFGQPQQYEQVVSGIRYHIAEFNANIYPTRAGEMTIGPATLECNIVTKPAGGNSPLGGNVFDDDFFNSFFDRYEKRPLTLPSKTSALTVLPLPEENRPAGFSGAVGEFGLDVAVGPTEVNVGDPITVKVKVSGDGNSRTVEPPVFTKAEYFKVYDPQIKEEDGSKRSEQVLIPESDQVTEVPALLFSFFDPALQRYQTITKGPFPVAVQRPKGDQAPLTVPSPGGSAATTVAPPVVGQDIVFIKESPGDFYVIGERFYRTVPFYFVVIVFLGGWGMLYAFYRRTHKIATDVVYARRLRAPREARRGLQEARRLQGFEDAQKFYDVLFRTLQGYLGNKLHLSAGALTLETIKTRLSGRVDAKCLEEIQQAFEECDAIRYAPSRPDTRARAQSYARIQRIIDALERSGS